MHASTSTNALAAVWFCARNRAIVVCSVPTVRFPVPRSRPIRHVAQLRTVCRRGFLCESASHRLGKRSARVPHLGHTRSLVGHESGTVLRGLVANHADVYGRGVLTQRPPLRSDPLLFHRTVLPTAWAHWSPLWPWPDALGCEGVVNPVDSARCRQRCIHMCTGMVLRTVPIFSGPPVRLLGFYCLFPRDISR